MHRQKDGSFKELKWEEAMGIVRDKVNAVKGDEIGGIIGD